MKQFKNFILEAKESGKLKINEAFNVSTINKVDKLVQKYLSRKLKTKMFRMPGVEEYSNNQDAGFGIRFFLSSSSNGFDSIRFNWTKSNIDTASVVSVDLFDKGKNTKHLDFPYGTSMARVLPVIVSMVMDNDESKGYRKYLNERTLTESSTSIYVELAKALVDENELPCTKGKMYSVFKSNFPNETASTSHKIFDTLETIDPSAFEKVGKRTYCNFTVKVAEKNESDLDEKIFTKVKVSSGSKNETYKESPEVEEMESTGLEKLSFEKQLEDMEEAVRLLYSNVTNSVFIGGRGGVGKTHNVEKVLDELGLEDGNGYFKNAGSISASGLYRLLYRNRDGLILFDDSDNVFGDQEARNVLKGATDTKEVRKLSWAKKSSDIIPGDEFGDDQEEDGLYPSFFDFKGKILFISNLPLDKLDPDGALRTRGLLLEINPTDEEVYNFMRKIAKNIPLPDGLTLSEEQINEVVDILEKDSPRRPNLRMLVRGLKIRAGTRSGFDWKSFVVRYA